MMTELFIYSWKAILLAFYPSSAYPTNVHYLYIKGISS